MSASAESSAPARQAPRPGPAETATASVAVGTGPAAAVNAAAAMLLELESDVRQLRTQGEIAHFMANETRIATRAQQIAVLARGRGGKLVVRAVSAIAHVDRSAPLVALFEGVVATGSEGRFRASTVLGNTQWASRNSCRNRVAMHPIRHDWWS